MSLEEALAKNTETMLELIAAMRDAAAHKSRPVAERILDAVETPAPEPEALTHKMLEAPMLAFAKAAGRPAVLALLGEFDATRLGEVAPERLAELAARLK